MIGQLEDYLNQKRKQERALFNNLWGFPILNLFGDNIMLDKKVKLKIAFDCVLEDGKVSIEKTTFELPTGVYESSCIRAFWLVSEKMEKAINLDWSKVD